MSNEGTISYRDCLAALGIQWEALRDEQLRLLESADRVCDLYSMEDVRALLLCAEKISNYAEMARIMGATEHAEKVASTVVTLKGIGANLCWAKCLIGDKPDLEGEHDHDV